VQFVHLPLETRCTGSGADFAPSTNPKAALASSCTASICGSLRVIKTARDVVRSQ
jgi:hypothetical protein